MGGIGLIGIIIALLALLLLKAAASDFNSLRILRKDGTLKDMRRIIVTPETWAAIGADKTKLKLALEDANVKITVQQVDKKSPVINSIIKKLKMDLPSAQVVMIASIKRLKFIWLDGKRLNAKTLLGQVD